MVPDRRLQQHQRRRYAGRPVTKRRRQRLDRATQTHAGRRRPAGPASGRHPRWPGSRPPRRRTGATRAPTARWGCSSCAHGPAHRPPPECTAAGSCPERSTPPRCTRWTQTPLQRRPLDCTGPQRSGKGPRATRRRLHTAELQTRVGVPTASWPHGTPCPTPPSGPPGPPYAPQTLGTGFPHTVRGQGPGRLPSRPTRTRSIALAAHSPGIDAGASPAPAPCCRTCTTLPCGRPCSSRSVQTRHARGKPGVCDFSAE